MLNNLIKSILFKLRRERDFECCGWNDYMDYKIGGYVDLPEACCKRVS